MTQDNLRHAQYGNDGTQIDNPQDIYPASQSAGPYTWATKPPASASSGVVIKVTDVGTTGSSGSFWISDGVYWRPINGSVILAAQKGSITTPISTLSGVTSGIFTVDPIIVPAGSLVPGRSQLELSFKVRRTGATATAILSTYLGTAKTASDANMYAISMAATTLLDVQGCPIIDISETGRVISSNYSAMGSSGGANAFLERTTNINTLAEMGMTIGISAANAADSFSLLSYELKLFS